MLVICQIVQRTLYFTKSNILSLLLRLQGQRALYNLGKVEEEHAKQSVSEVRQNGLVGDIQKNLDCVQEKGVENPCFQTSSTSNPLLLHIKDLITSLQLCHITCYINAIISSSMIKLQSTVQF